MTELSKLRVEVHPGHSQWLVVVVRRPTGIIYCHQCAGTACRQNEVEGYLVLLGDRRFSNGEKLSYDEFKSIFHAGDSCLSTIEFTPTPHMSLEKLRALVAEVGFAGDNRYDGLKIDESRLTEIAEAWVPVVTPSGPGVLIWENCD